MNNLRELYKAKRTKICSKCGKRIDTRSSPYEPVGVKGDFCKCKKEKQK